MGDPNIGTRTIVTAVLCVSKNILHLVRLALVILVNTLRTGDAYVHLLLIVHRGWGLQMCVLSLLCE
jgi:hypothetical protein